MRYEKTKTKWYFQFLWRGWKTEKNREKHFLEKTSQPAPSLRILHVATAEKWKTTKLAKYNAEEWLEIIKDVNTGVVISLKCSMCKKFKSYIEGIKGFNNQWIGDGCRRLLLSSARGGNSRRTSGISDGIYIPAGRMIFKICKNVRRRNFRQKQTEQV